MVGCGRCACICKSQVLIDTTVPPAIAFDKKGLSELRAIKKVCRVFDLSMFSNVGSPFLFWTGWTCFSIVFTILRQRMFSLKFSGHNCLHFLDQQVLLTHDHQIQSRLQAHTSKLTGKACLQLRRTMLDGNACCSASTLSAAERIDWPQTRVVPTFCASTSWRLTVRHILQHMQVHLSILSDLSLDSITFIFRSRLGVSLL